MKPFSIYIHIPFCFHKCPYCDFNTYAVATAPEQVYTAALLSELDYRASQPEWAGRPVQTIYFGGGTPSLFSPRSIRKILSVISKTFPVQDIVEVSLEANPGTVGTDSLSGYREAGVNRLSIGAQSFNSETLKTLGRVHAADQTDSAVEAARSVGFRNISIDIIYGVPNQTLMDLSGDLSHVLSLNSEHISAYGLTIEEGTPFYQSYKRGVLKLPTDERVLEMMSLIESTLSSAEFKRYEISNFCKTGREARHNMAYWNGDDYIGLGAGAHSHLGSSGDDIYGRRWSNFALPKRYMEEATSHGSAESWSEELGRSDAIFEFLFLGLRKIKGASLKSFEERFGVTFEKAYPALIEVLTSEKLIEVFDSHVRLTKKGLHLADSVIENFASVEISFPKRRRPIGAQAPLAEVDAT